MITTFMRASCTGIVILFNGSKHSFGNAFSTRNIFFIIVFYFFKDFLYIILLVKSITYKIAVPLKYHLKCIVKVVPCILF